MCIWIDPTSRDDWRPYKKRRFKTENVQRKDHVKTEGKHNHLRAKEIALRMKPTLPRPLSWISNLQKCEKIKFYCLSYAVCVLCYRSPSNQKKPNIVEITNSIQSAASRYFAIINLANIFYSVPISITSQSQFAFICKRTQYTLMRLHRGASAHLWFTIFTDKIGTTSICLQEPRYNITLITSSSKVLHWTQSLKTHQFNVLKSFLGSGGNLFLIYKFYLILLLLLLTNQPILNLVSSNKRY